MRQENDTHGWTSFVRGTLLQRGMITSACSYVPLLRGETAESRQKPQEVASCFCVSTDQSYIAHGGRRSLQRWSRRDKQQRKANEQPPARYRSESSILTLPCLKFFRQRTLWEAGRFTRTARLTAVVGWRCRVSRVSLCHPTTQRTATRQHPGHSVSEYAYKIRILQVCLAELCFDSRW